MSASRMGSLGSRCPLAIDLLKDSGGEAVGGGRLSTERLGGGRGRVAVWIDAKLVALMQLAASSFLAAAGFFVAVAALVVGYRNNFGWKPLVLNKVWGFGDVDEANENLVWLTCSFEVWNRRKYPVVIRDMEIRFVGRDVWSEPGSIGAGEGWCVTSKGTLYHIGDVSLGPSEHKQFEVEGASDEGAPANQGPMKRCEITVEMFDPKKNRNIILRSKTKWGRTWWEYVTSRIWLDKLLGRSGSITFSENRKRVTKGTKRRRTRRD